MDIYAGIDLGTSNSTISIINANTLDKINLIDSLKTLPIYQLDEDKNIINNRITLPSSLYFEFENKQKNVYTGVYAKSIYESGNRPMQSVKSLKTRIGGEAIVKIPHIDNEYSVDSLDISECSSILLKTIKNSTEQQLGKKLENAVVTVPAAFNNDEREAVINAMKLAGFKGIEILDEPTAVLLYDINNNMNDLFRSGNVENCLIYDIGGGTLDVTIARVSKSNKVDINVLARSPRRNFGGDDFDKALAAYMLYDFEQNKEQIENRPEKEQHMIIARLVSKAEKCKIEINEKIKNAMVNKKLERKAYSKIAFELLDYFKVNLKFDRKKIEELFSDLINNNNSELIIPIIESMNYAKMNKQNIDKVILTGGSADFFIVESAIKNFFGPNIDIKYILEEAAVSKGAAIHHYHSSGGCSGVALNISDKMADDIYLKVGNEFKCIIPRTSIPGSKGHFNIKIVEEDQVCIELFMYYGANQNPENYVPIEGKYISLTLPMKVGEEVRVDWNMNKDKIVTFSINELDETLILKSINSYDTESVRNSIVNKLVLNDSI